MSRFKQGQPECFQGAILDYPLLEGYIGEEQIKQKHISLMAINKRKNGSKAAWAQLNKEQAQHLIEYLQWAIKEIE